MANNEEITLHVSENSPYVIGARAYVEQTENGAVITIIDKEGTTTATVSNGKGIASATLNEDYTLTLIYTDGTSVTTTSIRGEKGESGVYCGSEEPDNPDVDVWIDPTGDPYPMEDEIADAVDEWITAHPEYVTTVQDGAITVPKFAAGVVDTGLNKAGYPADSKATGDAFTADRTRLTAVEGEADALDARITNLAQLTDGSTTGDAELMDARVVGSTTYSTLHEAIDTEFTNVKSAFNQIADPSVNLFNPTTVISGINISSNGAETASTTSHVSDYIAVEGGETYAFSGRPNSSYYYYLATYNSSKTFIERINVYQTEPRITLGSTVAYVRFSVYQNDFVDDFMFVKGLALPSNYIPHYNVDEDALPVISGKVNAIIEKSPNLFDISTITTGKYQNASGSLVNEASSAISDYIPVEGGETYTNNGNAGYWYIGTFDKNGTFIERLNAYQFPSWSFTLGASVAYIRISVYQNNFNGKFMLVKGSTLPTKYKPYGYLLKDDAILTTENQVSITKVSNTQLIIETGKGSHTLTHQTNAGKNLDTWRLTQGTANSNVLWSDVDVECPIKEKDASDFMGGYHGDEVFTDAVFLIDGEDTDITTIANGTVINCQNFTVCVESDIYYDGDTVNKAFVRNKRLVFEDNKVQIYNTYKFIGTTIQIDIATGCGLYPVSSNYVNGYSTNTGNAYISEATTNRNRYLDRVSFYGDEFTLNLKVLFGKGDAYYGVVYYYPDQTRYKAYFYQYYTVGSNYLTLNNGDELYSGYEIAFV